MAHFVAVNHVQHAAGFRIAALFHLRAYPRRNVQPARFQYARHQRHAQQRVVGGFIRHVPQMVVRLEIAVIKAESAQPFAHQAEMVHLFLRHPHPVAHKLKRQRTETVCRVQSQIDGVELDMRNRVQHRRIAFGRVHLARRQLRRRDQNRLRRPSRVAEVQRRSVCFSPVHVLNGGKRLVRQPSFFIGVV